MAVTSNYDKERKLSIAAAPGQTQTQTQTQNNAQDKTPNIASSGQGIGTAATYTKQQQQQQQYTFGQQPQGYESKYGAQLDGILQQIQNPQQFKYNFNGDELFKYYADLYTQKGRQASMDAMGQAAALTGGYGNSYAQQVGNQAYDQYLLSLYDKGMDLRDRAYQQYQDQRADVYNQYNALGNADAIDYNRYRDTVADWENQRDYDEKVREFDAQMQENIRQFDESLNWDKMSSEQKYAAEYAMQILANGQMPSEAMLEAAGLSAEDAQKLMAQIQAGGNSGVKNNKTYYVDKFGKYYYYDNEGNARSVNANDIKDTDLIDKSENAGTKGATAEINDKYRKENDKLKKHYDSTKK